MELLRIIREFSRHGMMSLSVLLGLLSGASGSAIINIVRRALHRGDAAGWSLLAWEFGGLALATAVARIASSAMLVALGARTVADLQRQLSHKILACNMRHLEEIGSHRLMVTLTNDIAAITAAITSLPVVVANAATVLGCLVYMAWLSWGELIWVLAAMAIGLPTYLTAMRFGSKRQMQAREIEDSLFKAFRGVTQGTKELKMRRARRAGFIAVLEAAAERYRRLRIEFMMIFLGGASWGSLLFYVAVGVVLFAAGGDNANGVKTGYVLALLFMMGPLQIVLNSIPSLTQAEVSVQKIKRLGISLAGGRAETGAEGPQPALPGWERLELKGVVLRYPPQDADEEQFTLGPIDLELRRGEIVFLAGGNGSGKTTLAKVLVGLYPPDAGEIIVDGERIDDGNRDEFRQRFSIVFSDHFLFEELFGVERADLEARARKYLADLRLKHKVRIEAGRLSTIDLSQGQRKRLALLVAFLEDSPVFVFDEWAADQDPEFRSIFYHHLLPELRARGKTVLVISHDERYFGVGDRIVQLEYGKLAEVWSPAAEVLERAR
jgi:putative pyoverdin transport system ATP-binding/permease protein